MAVSINNSMNHYPPKDELVVTVNVPWIIRPWDIISMVLDNSAASKDSIELTCSCQSLSNALLLDTVAVSLDIS